MAAVNAVYGTGWTTVTGTAGASYAAMSGMTVSTTAGTSGNAIITLSGDATSTRCILSFSGTGLAGASDTYSMRFGISGPATQMFVIPHGVSAGASVSYTLNFRSTSNTQTCAVTEGSIMVMAP